jgi:hypothetical protein
MTRRHAATGEFALATPADWFAIDLPGTPADADRLAGHIAIAHPELAGQREALAEMLTFLAEVTEAVGAVGAYGALFDASGVALPATLLVSLQPMGLYSLDEIGRELSGADHEDAPSAPRVFDLPAGRTVRTERLVEPSATGDDRRPVSFTVTYLTEIPGRGQVVVLTFRTPAITLVDQLRLVFHQIACSLLINPAGQVQPPVGSGLSGSTSPTPSDPAEAL